MIMQNVTNIEVSNNTNNNKFIYSPISHRVQWTVQKLKHNISTYVRNITIKEIIKIAQLMNTVKRE